MQHDSLTNGADAAASADRAPDATDQGGSAIHSQIRGSSLLLAGRFISLGLNLATQVLIVRYLSKLDYGAFAFAFALTETAAVFAGLGLDRAVSRYAAIYDERGQKERLVGVVWLACLAVMLMGLVVVAAAFGCRAWLFPDHPFPTLQVSVLLTMLMLTPALALDNVLVTLAAIFGGARLVFFRRVILAPGLRLGAVVLAMLAQGGVMMLTTFYVISGCLGVVLYGVMLWRLLVTSGRVRGLFRCVLEVPRREFFGFSLSVFGSDLSLVLRAALVVLMLELMHSTVSVAEYRAVLPLARLNELVSVAFSFLYIPLASRVFAKERSAELNHMYWQTACWIAVLTFPFFAVTYTLATPLTSFLFGSEYAGAGMVLAIVAVGFYFNAAIGFNSRTLKVIGKVRQLLVADAAALVVAVVLYYLWIPRYGAVGAALAVTVAALFHALAKQLALFMSSDIRWCPWRHLRVYGVIAMATVALTLWQFYGPANLFLGVCLVGVCCLAVLATSREALVVGDVFPELRRFPIFAWYETATSKK